MNSLLKIAITILLFFLSQNIVTCQNAQIDGDLIISEPTTPTIDIKGQLLTFGFPSNIIGPQSSKLQIGFKRSSGFTFDPNESFIRALETPLELEANSSISLNQKSENGIALIPAKSCEDGINYGVRLYQDDVEPVILLSQGEEGKKVITKSAPCEDRYISFHPHNFSNPANTDAVSSYLGESSKPWTAVYANQYRGDITSGSGTELRWNSGQGIVRFTSSIRYKTNVRSYKDDFKKVLNVQPVVYNRTNTLDAEEVGYIAEEIYDLGLTSAITKDEKGRVESIQYNQLLIYTIEVLKEHEDKLQKLEEENLKLKSIIASGK